MNIIKISSINLYYQGRKRGRRRPWSHGLSYQKLCLQQPRVPYLCTTRSYIINVVIWHVILTLICNIYFPPLHKKSVISILTLYTTLWRVADLKAHLEQCKMYQKKNPLGSIKPKILIAWLHHWSSLNNRSSILNFLSHLYNNEFKLRAHQ